MVARAKGCLFYRFACDFVFYFRCLGCCLGFCLTFFFRSFFRAMIPLCELSLHLSSFCAAFTLLPIHLLERFIFKLQEKGVSGSESYCTTTTTVSNSQRHLHRTLFWALLFSGRERGGFFSFGGKGVLFQLASANELGFLLFCWVKKLLAPCGWLLHLLLRSCSFFATCIFALQT
jgi:hypothetical protein